MKNGEKYKAVEERIENYDKFCAQHTCDSCPIGGVGKVVTHCKFRWLELEAEEEKPMKCPYCGGDVVLGKSTRIKTGEHRQIWCSDEQGCGYYGPLKKTLEGAIAAHNRVCRAVMDAKKEGDTDGSK